MNYPSIKEYKESILFAEDNFEQLKNLRPVLGADGEPVFSSGNFAVVFKMKDEETGKFHALKCFLREQEGRAEAYRMIAEELEFVSSTFLTPIKYLDKELFVDTNAGDETEFPVLLMDWVEGDTLDKYIRKHLDDQYELSLLAYQFSRLAMWLMPQPFAHGDLKPDNILVKSDGTLVLVDYDGMYVSAMKGQRARELGSPDFRHPSRTETYFDEHIDDFSLACILLSLKAISLQPSLLKEYGAQDRLLFSEKDYRNLSESEALYSLRPLMQDVELASLYSLFILATSLNNLSQVSFRLFNLKRPKAQKQDVILSTEVTEEDLANAWVDEYGVIYSADKKRLLQLPEDIDLKKYYIIEGTLVICDYAFCYRKELEFVSIPNSVKEIGEAAFAGCEEIIINLPGKIKKIGKDSFSCCYNLESVYIPSTVVEIGEGAFSDCKSLSSIVVDKDNKLYDSRNNCNAIIKKDKGILISGCYNTIIPNDISIIGNSAFRGCTSLLSISLPNSIVKIEDGAFYGCNSLQSIYIPYSIAVIGESAFSDCCGVTSIKVDKNNKRYDSRKDCNAIIESSCNTIILGCQNTVIPNDIEKLEDFVFSGCMGLKTIIIPQGVQEIGNGAFYGCLNLESIDIPKSVRRIGKSAFRECRNLTNINLPIGLKNIGEWAFNDCVKIQSVIIPYGIEKIDSWLFDGCSCLCSVVIPVTVKEIGFSAFRGCISLTSIDIPDSVNVIGFHSFDGCCSLSSIIIPNNVTKIGDNAFSGCSLIKSVTIPDSVLRIGSGAFKNCTSLSSVILPNNITRIESGLFYGCKQLNSICIPSNVTDIRVNAFAFCNITSIFIPKSVSYIDKRSFMGCSELESIVVEEGNSKYDSRNNCNAIIETDNNKLIIGCSNSTIPDTVITIGASAFHNCYRLKSITIPISIKAIEDYSFGLFLKTLIIKNDIIEIKKNALISCKYLETIYIPSGSRRRFEEMLPDYKTKFVEQKEEQNSACVDQTVNRSNISHIFFDNSIISKVERCHVYKRNDDWVLQVVFKNGKLIEQPYSQLQGNKDILLDKQSVVKLQMYVGLCEGFYINPKAIKIDCESPLKYTAHILFNANYIEISGITWGLNNNINEWRVKGIRSFNLDERLLVKRAEVVASDYGASVCFFMNAGGQTYIPLDKNSELTIGEELDINTAKLITLSQNGKKDVVRVME